MYTPAHGSALVISLPGETVRGIVARVVNDDTVLVELGAPLLNPARMHTYRSGDIICAKRAFGELGEFWRAVEDRALPIAVPKRKPKPNASARARKKRIARRKRKAT